MLSACAGSDEGSGREADTLADALEVAPADTVDTIEVTAPDITFDLPVDAGAEVSLDSDTGPFTCETDPGGFGCPCQANDDCDSDFCLPSRAGGEACTKYCTRDCPAGWDCSFIQFQTADPTFLCVEIGLNLCRPCTSDAQCQSGPLGLTADRCVRGDKREGSFCGIGCGEGEYCPAGYTCRSVAALDGVATDQCVPSDGETCACSGRAIAEQAFTACADHACLGRRTCSETGLSACDALPWAEETCDGRDNDCDGELDESFPDLDQDGSADCVDDDDDGDGVEDQDDNCPMTPNPEQANHDTDSAGEACDEDDDDDGVLDTIDNCPIAPNADQADSDGNGQGDACDADAPPPPSLLTTDPASPSADATPTISGASEPGSIVTFFADAHCEGAAMGSAEAAADGTFSGQAAVPTNATSLLFGLATDGAGNTSACSEDPLAYTHDTEGPAAPSITSSIPASPSDSLTLTLSGTAEAGSTVDIFTTSDCAGTAVGGGGADDGGNFLGIAVIANANTTTTFYARATDALDNPSPCSAGFPYEHRSPPPPEPQLVGTVPSSPTNQPLLQINGIISQSGLTLRLFKNSTCSGPFDREQTNAPTSFSITPTSTRATTTFSALAVDGARMSNCSEPLTFVFDAAPPAAPDISGTNPTSPSTDLTPNVEGTTSEAGLTIEIYRDTACTGSPIAQAAVGGTSFSIMATAIEGSATTFYALAIDGAGNPSPCSSPVSYTHVAGALEAPILTGFDPPSPSQETGTDLFGTVSEAQTTLWIYKATSCTGNAVAHQSVSQGAFSLRVYADPETTTYFSAKAVGASGTTSACSNAIAFTHDHTSPAPPTITGTDPPSPGASTSPKVLGTAYEVGLTINIYTGCFSNNPVATGTTTPQAPGAAFAISAPATNGTTTFYAKAIDAAGNSSSCSNSFVYSRTP